MRRRRREDRAQPPRLAERLLVGLLPDALAECIAGDLREQHSQRVREVGAPRARLLYWWQVFTFRYIALRREARRAYPTVPSRAPFMSGLLHDLRFAVRGLRAQPLLSLIVIATLSLSIAATTVVYGVVDGVLLRPLAYAHPDRLVQVWSTNGDWLESENPMLRSFANRFPASYPFFEEWRSQARAFEALGTYDTRVLTVTGGEQPERVGGAYATAGVFAALGIAPALGRVYSYAEDESGGPALAVLSHGYWQRQFGGEHAVLGRSLTIDDRTYTVVGVMPRSFYFPAPEHDVWLTFPDEVRARGRDSQFLETVGLLRPGVGVADAQRDLEAVTERVQEARPEERGWGVRVVPRLEEVVGEVRPILYILLGAAVLVLAIASANVVNLLLVRSSARRRELAVRAALGANRRRLVQTLLCESVVLAFTGGALGAALSVLALPLLATRMPASLPRTLEIAPDARMFAFALVLTALTALVAGSGPAWAGARRGLASVLRAEARGSVMSRESRRTQSFLVVAEVGLAFLLLAATGLLGRSLLRTLAVDPGFDARNLVVASVDLPHSRYGVPPGALAFTERLRERILALAGVEAVAFAEDAPFSGRNSAGTIALQGLDAGQDMEASVDQAVVSDGYFEALGIPVLEGRSFRPSDRTGAQPVVLVSRALADRFWPGLSPVGARIKDGGSSSGSPWLTVIGVVGDVHHTALTAPPVPRMYQPLAQHEGVDLRQIVIVRAATDPAAVLAALPAITHALDPEVPVTGVTRMGELIARSTSVARFRTFLIGSLGLLAAVLAFAGLYGVVAFTVARRSAEIGVRMALGAEPGRVMREVIGRGLRLAAAGIAVGLVGAFFSLRLLETFLFAITPGDPLTLGFIALLLLATAAAAAWIPGRRAARTDPLDALRHD